MTCLEKLIRANRWRIRKGDLATGDEAGWNGHFLVPLDGSIWMVRLNDTQGWRHLAVTNAQKKMATPWHVTSEIKRLFFADDSWVAEFHPPDGSYIADHWARHLWEPLEEPLPAPPVISL